MAEILDKRFQGLIVVTATLTLLAACGSTAQSSERADDPRGSSSVVQEPASAPAPSETGSPKDQGDWSREQAFDYAQQRMNLQIDGTDGSSQSISQAAAVQAAVEFMNPHGELAGAYAANVTSTSEGIHEDENPDSKIKPALSNTRVWIVLFHVQMPKYSDVTMMGENAPSENPMVSAIDGAVVDAETGNVYFGRLN